MIFDSAGSSLLRRFSLVAASGSYSLVVVHGLLSASPDAEHGPRGSWVSVVAAPGLLEHRLSSCGARGLVAPQHVGSSWIRDRTHVSPIDMWILYH